jgi:acetylornithine/N-succinyldiaminopimelate aminotransferase
MEDPNSKFFANTYRKKPLTIERGSGSYLFTEDGKKYLDFLSGISINNLGYSNSEISARIEAQLKKIIHPSNYYYTEAQIELAKGLLTTSGLSRVFFANGGTEANEGALSFISTYGKATPQRNEILVFSDSFFGRTYGSRIAATGGTYRDLRFIIIPFNDANAFTEAVTESTLGVCLELVLGHGGIRKIDVGTANIVKATCKENDLLLMIDEVQTGLGRAGKIFLFQEFGFQPDLVTLGKSLGGGLPLSAVLISDRIGQTIQPGDYGCTMGGNSLACAGGTAVLDFLSDVKNIDEINKKGAYLLDGLREIAKKHSNKVKDARCYGLMGALEMHERSDADSVVTLCLEYGLLLDTVNKKVLRMLPPFTVSYNEIDMALNTISTVLETTL